MANSEVRNSRTTSVNSTDNSAVMKTGSSSGKKRKRRMKKQVRNTLGGLFLASALVVAALPVQDVQAGVGVNPVPSLHVKTVNYLDENMNTFEDVDGTAAPNTWQSTVPYIKPGEQIYTTGSSSTQTNFQFAFVAPAGSANKIAVILGASINNLPGGRLTVPATVSGFLKYASTSTSNGYCAVNKDGQYMFYNAPEDVPRTNPSGKNLYQLVDSDTHLDKDSSFDSTAVPEDYNFVYDYEDSDTHVVDPSRQCSNKMVLQQTGEYRLEVNYFEKIPVPDTDPVEYTYEPRSNILMVNQLFDQVDKYFPCYEDTYESAWKAIENRNEGADLYYYDVPQGTVVDPSDTSKFVQVASNAAKGRIKDVEVFYVGRQYLDANPDGTWAIGPSGNVINDTNKNKGVFANAGQIVDLVTEKSLIGIGDYAFYGCTGLKGITLENGIKTIGNGAFMDCINMTNFTMDINSNISIIGEKAFNNCQALTEITIPVNVRAIGSSCFENCKSITKIDFNGGPEQLNVILETIGDNAFKYCTNLGSITFPAGFNQKDITGTEIKGYYVDYLDGCTGLQFIKFNNKDFDLLEPSHPSPYDRSCSIGKFVDQLSESFYFEGTDDSKIHQTSKDHSASFKYEGEDKFEKVIYCTETPSHANTFMVNSANELIDMRLDDDCKIIEIPDTIGDHTINTIGEFSFQYRCNVHKVVVPSSVTKIEKNAFKGCHNLEDIVFKEPVSITEVGENAFATQNIISSGSALHCSKCGEDLPNIPKLTFTGTIAEDSWPFMYAMNPANKINNEFQQDNTYITFYSNWPTNLTVQYNYDTGLNTLINYPRYSDLSHYAVKKYDGTQGTSDVVYPGITGDYVAEALSAVSTPPESRTTAQNDIINSAQKITLPTGIQAIKEGIFSDYDKEGNPISGSTASPNLDLETITTYSVKNIEPFSFAGCENLTGFYQNAYGCEKIDNYAFKNCDSLDSVEIASSVTELGLRPFAGCDNLINVSFGETGNFVSDSSVIYSSDKSKVYECLECRGKISGNSKVGPDELASVTELAEEAFMDCDSVGNVDLSSSQITKTGDKAFALMDQLYSVSLPETCKAISRGSFWQTSMSYVEVPASITLVQPEAFANVETQNAGQDIVYLSDGNPHYLDQTSGHKIITAYCVEGSAMDTYADDYYYINPEYYKPTIFHKVFFYDYFDKAADPVLLDQQDVEDGKDANPPTDIPTHEGYTFTGWFPSYKNIVNDTSIYASFDSEVWEVTFIDTLEDDPEKAVLKTEKVGDGKSATPPESPEHEGYKFVGWTPDYNNIHDNSLIKTKYDPISNRHSVVFYNSINNTIISNQKVYDGEDAIEPAHPVMEGYEFTGWLGDFTNVTEDLTIFAKFTQVFPTPTPSPIPSPTTTPTSSPSPSGKPSPSGSNSSASPTVTPTPTATPTVKTYSVSVSGGSGTGNYQAGQIVALNAYDMGTGQVFDRWTTSTAGVAFANAESTSTFFTMPAVNVAITATFKTGQKGANQAGSSAGGSNSGTSSGNGSKGGNTGTTNNPSGTTVQVTKGGISNTGVAGASVSGSTDNFVIKVTDDPSASDLALKALQNRFGDITRIKYLPFDISLYDSTGRTKIADTNGLSVNLTLPLPDELASYAGNNKVASVAGGNMEDLNSRFTTVDGVPCISFTAPHLSPYVIYVDTSNLTEATIDYTPKTGDPIHPKWFLAIGLACISLIFFFKRDKKVKALV